MIGFFVFIAVSIGVGLNSAVEFGMFLNHEIFAKKPDSSPGTQGEDKPLDWTFDGSAAIGPATAGGAVGGLSLTSIFLRGYAHRGRRARKPTPPRPSAGRTAPATAL